MCLYNIDADDTKKYKTQTEPLVAYKIVLRKRTPNPLRKTYYIPPFCSSHGISVFGKGKNIDDPTRKRLQCDISSETYKTGFHAFLWDEDFDNQAISAFIENYFFAQLARNLRVIKVFIDPEDIIKVGWQASCKVVVSNAFTIKSFKNYFHFRGKKDINIERKK